MKRSSKIATAVALSLGLGLAVGVYAQPGQVGSGTGEGMHAGMQHGMKGGMGPGATGHGPAGQGAGHALMTSEERTALQEKMRNAKTPEERQQIAQATRAEMQKRAKEKGVTLPEGRGSRHGATTEHQH